MKKKNVLMIALSLCLAAVIAVGGTLAYFTSNTDKKQNAFTTGNVNIELVDESPVGKVDPDNPDSPELVTGEKNHVTGDITYEDVMPGDVISKKVGVNLDADSENAWIAIKVDISATPVDENTLSTVDALKEVWSLIDNQVKTTEWMKKDISDTSAVYYLKSEADNSEDTYVLFDRLAIPGEEWGNAYADMTFSIDVQGFAVQAKNLTGPDEADSTAIEEIDKLIQSTPSLLA